MKILGLELKIPQWFSRDKREAQRVRLFEDLYVDYQCTSSGKKGTGEGGDISMVGLRFFSDDKLQVDTPLELTLRLSPGVIQVEQIHLRARVVRCHRGFREKQHRVACAFDSPDPATQKHLEAYIDWLKEREKKYLFFRYNAPQ